MGFGVPTCARAPPAGRPPRSKPQGGEHQVATTGLDELAEALEAQLFDELPPGLPSSRPTGATLARAPADSASASAEPPNTHQIDRIFQKIEAIENNLAQFKTDIRLEVDGGAGLKNIEKLDSCGIDMFVVGRGVFHADDYGAAVTELKALAEKGAASRK